MHIVFVGIGGVPHLGRACDPRLTAIANLLDKDAGICILNRYSSLRKRQVEDITLSPTVDCREIIRSRKTGKVMSAILFALSVFFEPFVLLLMEYKKHIDILHVYSGHYIDFLLYYCVSRLIGAKVVYEYVEYRLDKNKDRTLYHQWNSKLCDYYGAYLWDGCIAISNFLERKAKEVNPCLPIIKVTPLCDFTLFEMNHNSVNFKEPYLMFCGHASYFEVVKLIVDAYRQSVIYQTKRCLLILSGGEDQISRIKDYAPDCVIKSRLPYAELISYYKYAYALMIPLRNTLEDCARFPNKICEYTAAGGLIVTTNFGEIPYYFKDGDNAVVAQDCTSAAIAGKLDEIESGKYDIDRTKKRSKETGNSFFSIEAYQKVLPAFFQSLLTK